jgi:integrase/recombinase XerD
MLEELHRRNFSATTIRTYLHGVEHFSRYFRRRPDQLGPEDIRKYQAALFTQFKFSPNTVILRLASLRFFYIHVLKRGWSIAETPYPKKVRHLPSRVEAWLEHRRDALSEEGAAPSRGAQSGRSRATD